MLIGRKTEQEQLLRTMQDEDSAFIAVYGRRRVGKTYLVRETFGERLSFCHTGMAHSPMGTQLAAWRNSLRAYGMRSARMPHTWLDAFEMLKDLVHASDVKKKVLFIDELPWMDTQRSGFLPALEHFWNGWASARKDIVLIVCGSATSWIINKIVRNHGGLHNRLTQTIHLHPFTLRECERYAQHRKLGMNRRQLVECYMIMGGIPYYWSKLERGRSLAQNVDALFFSADGAFRNEFQELYASLFRNPESYLTVIHTLCSKRMGMTRCELVREGKMPDNGRLTTILEELEACGFIRKYHVLGSKRNAIFQLIDFYTLFYAQFVLNNKQNDEQYWSLQQGTPLYNNWCGLAFERVCLQHIAQIKQALGIAGVASSVYSWRSNATANKRGAQIDLLIDRNDQVIDLCEIKFTKTTYEMGQDEDERIQNRLYRFVTETNTPKAVHLVLISAQGVKQNSYSAEFQAIITSEQLFKS